MNRDLVIVCAGNQSLHPRFADGGNFDLWIIYCGGLDDRTELAMDAQGS